jgi:hypothetical protein
VTRSSLTTSSLFLAPAGIDEDGDMSSVRGVAAGDDRHRLAARCRLELRSDQTGHGLALIIENGDENDTALLP